MRPKKEEPKRTEHFNSISTDRNSKQKKKKIALAESMGSLPEQLLLTTVSPERGIFRPPPRSHLGETHAKVACQCVGSATRCGHQLRVKPKVHEDGLRYNA